MALLSQSSARFQFVDDLSVGVESGGVIATTDELAIDEDPRNL